MITYQQEDWDAVVDEFLPLGQMNFDECDVGDGYYKYDLDLATFSTLNRIGMLSLTTARLDGGMVGYALSLIMPRYLQFNACCSQQIGLFVHPDYRKSTGIGIELMRRDEENLRNRGVQKVYGGFTMDKDLSALFKRQGWKAKEMQFTKWIAG